MVECRDVRCGVQNLETDLRTSTMRYDRARRSLDCHATYNHHRGHTAIGGPPINRVNNLPNQYS
jgi:hypothetical protein